MDHNHSHHNNHGKSSHDNHTHGNKTSKHGSHGNYDKQDHSNHHAHMIADFRKRFWISLVLSVPVLIFSPFLQGLLDISITFPFQEWVIFAIATAIFFYGGWPFFKGLANELKQKHPGMMTLVAVAISVAYGYSAAVIFGLPGKQLLWELVTLVDVMLLGHWIEMRSIMGASKALESLAKLLPAQAHKVENGSTVDVSVEQLQVGDVVLVKPGEKIPVDGIVIEGNTTINESMLTGETKPAEKKVNDEVVGGSINNEGSITIKIKKIGKDTYISQIIELVRKSQASKSKTQNLANKAAMWLTVIALGGGMVTLLSWLLLSDQGIGFALERTIAVIVIACPHALGLAIPLVVSFSTSLSARNGLLIRNRTAFEQARNINFVIFDKTGTLTKGEFGISDVISFSSNLSQEEIINLAASVEQRSEHPIAQAIVNKAKNKAAANNFQAIPGKGAQAEVNGKTIFVVSPGYLKEHEIAIDSAKAIQLSEQGKTVVYVLENKKALGAIALDDIIKDEAKLAIKQLQQMGITPIMLTGDSVSVAKRVAKELGIEQFFAEVLPEQKANKIKEMQRNNQIVAMVGDGINDAPALAQADIGIAIGAGTNVAIETADIILVKSDPRDVVATIDLAKKTYSKMVQNLWWASGYNIVALPLAAGVLAGAGILLSPAVGAIFMSLSTVIVATNASLLKFTKPSFVR